MSVLRQQAAINIPALQHNMACVRSLVPGSRLLAMIKSDGYGHGLLRVASALSDADGFGVAYLDAALRLRAAGIGQRIVVMTGFLTEEEMRLAIAHHIDLVVFNQEQLDGIIKLSSDVSGMLSIWLKVDTGMHRLGFAPREAQAAYQHLLRCPWVQQPIIWMTHLSEADDFASTASQSQYACFHDVVIGRPAPRSIVHSAGIFRYPDYHAEWVRPGIMLYGVSPFPDAVGADYGLQPVMHLTAPIIAINALQRGDRIGYGGTWECPESMSVGVVGIGYGDGYPRHAPSGTPVLVGNTLCPLVGRVSMDMITVDLRSCPQARVGDRVILWGRGLPIERIAKAAGTIPYELLCGVGSRVVFISEEIATKARMVTVEGGV